MSLRWLYIGPMLLAGQEFSPAVHGHKVSESSCLRGTELITAMHPKRGESTLDDFD